MKGFSRIDSEYTALLQLFTSLLNVKEGRPFGQLNQPWFGMSDGNEGVQWNIAVSTDTKIIRLGVNLEGKAYKDWPISTFILSEMKNPKIREIGAKLKNPEDVYIRFSRDAWQCAARPAIVEKYLGGREFSFAEIDSDKWELMLSDALNCLNKKANYRGRVKQKVTLENIPKNGEQVRVMEVTPHLTIWSPINLDGDREENINRKITELKSVYDWVANSLDGA
ncbi:MAG: hypothetical protein EXR80_07695 [Methylococcales bacterium]|nr:hypothetical protein [Methylococcales bacterium]